MAAAGASWGELIRELRERTSEPIAHASFVLYFILAVVITGGAGIWLELVVYLVRHEPGTLVSEPPDGLRPVLTAVITFFSALAGSAAMQLIWAENRSKPLRACATLVLVIAFIAALLVGLLPLGSVQGLWYGTAATLFALWMWWVANAKQPDLRDDVDPEDAVGGDVAAPLSGNLEAFTK